MQQSSAEAAALLKEAGATGCTDVTGFGLLGHLGEMTRASQVLSWLTSSVLFDAKCEPMRRSAQGL